MKERSGRSLILAAALLAAAAVATGCGGGGGSATAAAGPDPAAVSEAIEWTPPSTYFDNTPLNPMTDLDHYEIYVGSSPVFTDNDAPVAAVAAVTLEELPGNSGLHRKATNRFNLTHLVPLVEPGLAYYVSVRAVGIDNLVSSFSTPVVWDLG